MNKTNIKQITFTITKTVCLNNIQVSNDVLELIEELKDEQLEFCVDDIINLDKSKHEALDAIMQLVNKADEEDDQPSYYGAEIDEFLL